METKDLKNLLDEELVSQYIIDKSEQVFEELYRRYNDRIFNYMKRFLYFSPEDIVRELLAEVFIKVYLNIVHLKDLKSFKSWIYHIAHNICINHIKSQKDTVRGGQEILEATADKRVDIEKELLDKEVREFLSEQIRHFDDQTREIVIFKFYQSLTYEEISELIHIPVRSIKYKMKVALEKLSTKLKGAGYVNGCV
ncbi:MAG: RNA polymerase sigma factor [bacterium]|nr:RNA polymerase sigma factor [bacterium]